MLSASDASAQRMAVKSNLLADALASPNIGVEFLVSPRWTLDIAAHYQPFAPRDGRRWKHWLLQPEARRWLCTPFAGHFWGVHALGGRFNVGGVHLPFNILKGAREARYEGWLLGAGISYGYHWVLSPVDGRGSKSGCGGGFSSQRPLPLRSLRQQAARYERQGILRPYKGCRVRGIYD